MEKEIFERYAAEYDAWYDLHREDYLDELALIRSALPEGSGLTVEVGAGSGRFAGPIGIRLGIEPSRALGRMAYLRGTETVRAAAEDLPLKDGSCSVLLFVTVLCFIDDPARALKEAGRVLSPGGTLVLGALVREGTVMQKFLCGEKKGRFLSHARFYSSAEILDLLTEAGFTVTGEDLQEGFGVFSAKKE